MDFLENTSRYSGHRSAPFSDELKSELLALNTSGADELHRAALAGNAVSRTLRPWSSNCSVTCNSTLVDQCPGRPWTNRPPSPESTGRATHCSCKTPPCWRSSPAFGSGRLSAAATLRPGPGRTVGSCIPPRCPQARPDRAGAKRWRHLQHQCAPAQGPVIGFDCGPGNALMDYWCRTAHRRTLRCSRPLGGPGRCAPGPAGNLFERAVLSKSTTEKHRKGLVQCGVAQQQVAALCGPAPRRYTSHFDRADCPGLREHSQTIRWRCRL